MKKFIAILYVLILFVSFCIPAGAEYLPESSKGGACEPNGLSELNDQHGVLEYKEGQFIITTENDGSFDVEIPIIPEESVPSPRYTSIYSYVPSSWKNCGRLRLGLKGNWSGNTVHMVCSITCKVNWLKTMDLSAAIFDKDAIHYLDTAKFNARYGNIWQMTASDDVNAGGERTLECRVNGTIGGVPSGFVTLNNFHVTVRRGILDF